MTFILASILLVSGCASPSKSVNMVPKNLNIKNQYPYSVNVEVGGGSKTNPLWTSQISDQAFREAITNSLTQSGIFSKVINGSNADYLLEVIITNCNQPIVGFDMTVSMVTHWELTNLKTNKEIWEDFISSSYTATVGDAFAGIKRLRLANEGAARENIKEGISTLSSLDEVL
ncbi:MAG: hypothetical protein U9Q05_14525 [Thermodesulfobacteriota bacterium]|nr:hypothetical protein [Thermodesulfobacteriota bacterium]